MFKSVRNLYFIHIWVEMSAVVSCYTWQSFLLKKCCSLDFKLMDFSTANFQQKLILFGIWICILTKPLKLVHCIHLNIIFCVSVIMKLIRSEKKTFLDRVQIAIKSTIDGLMIKLTRITNNFHVMRVILLAFRNWCLIG